jgi:cell division protein FtsQ
VAKVPSRPRNPPSGESAGLWQQPVLMNLLSDVLIVLAVAALAWAALTALKRLPVFPLRELVLHATPQRVSIEQLEHAARSSIVGNFFTVDLDATRRAFEKLPWVRHVAVRRQWPDSMHLVVEEHEVTAHWRHLNGSTGLVNRQGEIFIAELPADSGPLPQLSGPEGSAADLLRRHAEFSTLLAPAGRHIEMIALSPRLAWQLKLDDGMTVKLGRDLEQISLGARLARFASHYDQVEQRRGTLRVADLRYPNGFALAGGASTGRAGGPTEATGRKS